MLDRVSTAETTDRFESEDQPDSAESGSAPARKGSSAGWRRSG